MWMMELTMKANTAPNRMGSHSALSSVMSFSPLWLFPTPRILQPFAG